MQPHKPALGDQLDHFDRDLDHVADLDRSVKIEGLRTVDGAGPREPGAEHRGNKARGVQPVGDALAEAGVGRIDIAQMQRVIVARESCEADHVAVHDGLHQAFPHADMEILEAKKLEHSRIDDGSGSGSGSDMGSDMGSGSKRGGCAAGGSSGLLVLLALFGLRRRVPEA